VAKALRSSLADIMTKPVQWEKFQLPASRMVLKSTLFTFFNGTRFPVGSLPDVFR